MIDILLATYNGEQYLEEQLDSLFNQSEQNFRVLIRDDGSSDNTVNVLKTYALDKESRIQIIEDNLGNLGVSKSFMTLLKHSTSDYIMFCDQDDVWLSNKIERSLAVVKSAEKELGSEVPVLCFTDLRVVDNHLDLIYESMMKEQRMKPSYLIQNHYRLIAQNPIAGCTIMMNKTIKQHALPFPDINVLHDHWLGPIAAYFGKVYYLNESSLLYRQHSRNEVGLNKANLSYLFFKLFKLGKLFKHDGDLIKNLPFQVSYFYYVYVKIKLNLKRMRRLSHDN